ncbi:signal recognition particle-docking protein FtsY [Bailinhaonella thermotolerans]|uniref:Signal recognition particle receptor FtsY n=1 Tax=Bailinhaonella thermotolerans TaxID=1070861 RepID=A0A3A4A9C0_9ACTN|nr:signal recognition particle-docking protein FtsY [Bailinhaonella thermotolerans]
MGTLYFVFRPGRKAVPPKTEQPPPDLLAPREPARGAGDQEEGGVATLPRPPVEEKEEPPAPPVETKPELELPPPSAGRMVRLRARLARSQNALGRGLLDLLSRDKLDDDTWDEVEETLITADVGVAPARAMVEELRTKVKVLGTRTPEELRGLLREELLKQVGGDMDRTLRTAPTGERPAVLMMVGVNGTGKTTTCGKLARSLIGDGRTVVLGAADTFRAAAADQLETWGARVGATVVRKEEGADPASVAFDAVATGLDLKVDTVIVDTAGRLHTKTGLMDELGKVKRVIEKKAPVDEVILVLDATTGQNGMRQARVFAEVVNITGIALTKLDGTAKGGIVINVQRELGVPVKLVGLGEGPDDLAPFDPEVFVDAIIGDGKSA